MTPPVATSPIRTVIVDDEALARDAIRLRLENEPGLEVVGEAADGADAVELLRRLQPDLVFANRGQKCFQVMRELLGLVKADHRRQALERMKAPEQLVEQTAVNGRLLQHRLQSQDALPGANQMLFTLNKVVGQKFGKYRATIVARRVSWHHRRADRERWRPKPLAGRACLRKE